MCKAYNISVQWNAAYIEGKSADGPNVGVNPYAGRVPPRDGRNAEESAAVTMARLGLKPASEESMKSTYAVNNQLSKVNAGGRSSTNPNPNEKLKAKYGY